MPVVPNKTKVKMNTWIENERNWVTPIGIVDSLSVLYAYVS